MPSIKELIEDKPNITGTKTNKIITEETKQKTKTMEKQLQGPFQKIIIRGLKYFFSF